MPQRAKLNNHMASSCNVFPLQNLVFVEGASESVVPSAAALESCFELAMSRRATAATYLNAESSRSHLICMMRMQRRDKITGTTVKSKLSFVDLAGSERVARSGALEEKDRLDEARAINKSLSALGDVISALTSGLYRSLNADYMLCGPVAFTCVLRTCCMLGIALQHGSPAANVIVWDAGEKHIPYRNHKLTELMSDSLGGSAKTLMVVNVSPLLSDASESKNSLDYAQRVKEVTNESSRNFETAEIARLRAIIEDMKASSGGGASAFSLAPPTPGLASALGL
jgi:kinesin family member C2/C3